MCQNGISACGSSSSYAEVEFSEIRGRINSGNPVLSVILSVSRWKLTRCFKIQRLTPKHKSFPNCMWQILRSGGSGRGRPEPYAAISNHPVFKEFKHMYKHIYVRTKVESAGWIVAHKPSTNRQKDIARVMRERRKRGFDKQAKGSVEISRTMARKERFSHKWKSSAPGAKNSWVKKINRPLARTVNLIQYWKPNLDI